MAKASLKSSLNVLKRTVTLYDADGVATGTQQVDAGYKWVVVYGGQTYQINADFHLPCIPAVDPENLGAKVATISKVGLPNGELRYGPADVYEGQVAAWIAALA